MFRIQNITSVPYQRQTLVLEDGTNLTITMKYFEMQAAWFFTEILWGNFRLNGFRVCNNPNLLYQWRKLIPFGLACISDGAREPSLQEDFQSGASRLYVLEAADVNEYFEFLNVGQ
jgi:hypothetical protein